MFVFTLSTERGFTISFGAGKSATYLALPSSHIGKRADMSAICSASARPLYPPNDLNQSISYPFQASRKVESPRERPRSRKLELEDKGDDMISDIDKGFVFETLHNYL